VGLPRIGAALGLALATGCGGSPTASAPPAEVLALRLTSDHFRILAGQASDATLREVRDALEATLPRVAADLQAGPPRSVDVLVWQDEASWRAELQRYFGRVLPSSGYVTGASELRVLATPQVARNASHELCHVISLWLQPNIANNPRWLWESVALFENGELVDPRTQPDLVAGRFPTLAQLDADVTASQQVYQVGYLIGEFVVERWGRDGLVRLIRANGDVAALGVSVPQFETDWAAFVRERYLS
jgi:hypothetical protein